MLGKLLKLNIKGVQMAFFAGSAVGTVMGTVAGAGIGLGVGALLGVLFAPKSGTEMRGLMKDGICDAMDSAKSQGMMLKEKAMDAYSNVQEKVNEKINNITQAA